MHDRESNDRSTSTFSPLQNKIGSFRRYRPQESYVGALLGDFALLMLLLVATAGAIVAIQSPLGLGRYSLALRTRTQAFTESFSSALVRDKAWWQKQTGQLAFSREQHMSFAQLMNRWQPLIEEASQKFHVPAAWIRAVMERESGGRTMLTADKPITSPVGAVGLMQLMPGTYDEMREEHKLGRNPFDPHDNIMAGAAYLHWLHRKYGFPAMFAAYNDGPGNLEAKGAKGANLKALPAETRNYVRKICAELGAAAPQATEASLAKLTRPNGKPVWIDRTSVASVRAALPGEYAGSVKTVITVGKVKQGVRESLAAVRSQLRVRATYG